MNLSLNNQTNSNLVSNASRGLTRGFQYTDSTKGVTPDVSMRVVEDIFRKDSTVRAGIRAWNSATLRRGYTFKSKTQSEQKRVEDFFKKARFRKLLKKWINILKVYEHSFLEIRRSKTAPKELHLLETVEMEIDTDKHGDIERYLQRPTGTNETVIFKPTDVVYLTTEELTSNVWGEVGFESLFLLVALKQYILKYVNYLFATNKFRDFFDIKNAGTEQVKEFVSYLKRCEEDITKPLILRGEAEHKVLRQLNEATDLVTLLNACDNRILMLLQVPPIIAGIPDNSNRGSSETQERNFAIAIEDFQETIKDCVNEDLLPKLGFNNTTFDFPTFNQKELSKDIEMAERLHNMGVKDEHIEHYLRNVGLDVPEDKMFKTAEEKMVEQNKMFGEQKSDDMRPSRQRKPSDEMSENQDEPTSREDQFVGNSEKFSTYPYVINDE